MKIKSYASMKAKAELEKFEYEPKPIGHNDVEVSITHCGICHSDIHLIDNDWQMSSYPLVPGHEIVGTVEEAGSGVNHLKKGDRVGIGWQRGSCHECEYCVKGDENLCAKNEATAVGNHGGFAESIRLDSSFAFKIPKGMASENAAPLLCGGVTVFSPLRLWATPQMKVGVVGIGGLGHLALQFASAYGCKVTALSSSPDKKIEAMKFGAHDMISSKDKSELEKHAGSLDLIMSTVTADLDWPTYMNLLRPDGRLCILGASPGPLNIGAFDLIMGRRTVCGSPIGGRRLINEMLQFAARHNIVAKTEVVPMVEVNSAISRVRENKARYRMVLKNK